MPYIPNGLGLHYLISEPCIKTSYCSKLIGKPGISKNRFQASIAFLQFHLIPIDIVNSRTRANVRTVNRVLRKTRRSIAMVRVP